MYYARFPRGISGKRMLDAHVQIVAAAAVRTERYIRDRNAVGNDVTAIGTRKTKKILSLLRVLVQLVRCTACHQLSITRRKAVSRDSHRALICGLSNQGKQLITKPKYCSYYFSIPKRKGDDEGNSIKRFVFPFHHYSAAVRCESRDTPFTN